MPTLSLLQKGNKMKLEIHPLLEKYHGLATCDSLCLHIETCCILSKQACDNRIGCGPLRDSCLMRNLGKGSNDIYIPCPACGFWTGCGMKEWDIRNAATMLEIMTISSMAR